MKTITTTALVALLVTVSTSFGGTAYAQPAPRPDQPQMRQHRVEPGGPFHQRFMRHRNGLEGLLHFGRTAENLEIAFIRLSYRLDLTNEQQTLFDALRDDAMAAQETFATALADALPERERGADRPDIADRLETRLAIASAHLAAMEAVLPAFTSFYDSLTEQQKASLESPRHHRGQPRDRDRDRNQDDDHAEHDAAPRRIVQSPAIEG